jgi:hypothetical protein
MIGLRYHSSNTGTPIITTTPSRQRRIRRVDSVHVVVPQKKMLPLLLSSLLLLLLLIENTPTTDAYVVWSRQSTTFAMDALMDAASRKIVNAGVIFRDEHAEITAAGQADTQCITAIGDIRGFDRNVHDSPQFCVHVANFPRSKDINYGVVAGVAGRQAKLYTMEFLGEYDEAPLLEPFNLPIDTFPVALTTDPDGGVYVGLHDTDGTLVRAWNKPLEDLMDYIESVRNPEQARVISPLTMKVNMTSGRVLWQTELTTTGGQSLIGDTIHIPSRNVLVVAGSSDGVGTGVGANVQSGDWDGYVTIIDAESGAIDDSAAELTSITADHSLRIQSQIGRDDFIHGICALEEKIFIVGSTTGILEDGSDRGGAFVMKLDLDTLNILWRKQFRGTGGGDEDDGPQATKCAVRGGTLYVAGHVPAGVWMEQDDSRTQPSNDQDVMAIAMDQDSSEVYWVRQIDSRRHDQLTNIMISGTGDLFVMGNAMDFDQEFNDVYFMTVSLQGGVHDWLGLPEDVDPIDVLNPGIDNGELNDDMENVNDDGDDDHKMIIIIVAVSIPLVLLVMVIIYGMTTAAKEGSSWETTENEGPDNKNSKNSAMTAESNTGDGLMT